MSGRSVGVGSEVGELADIAADDTPHASAAAAAAAAAGMYSQYRPNPSSCLHNSNSYPLCTVCTSVLLPPSDECVAHITLTLLLVTVLTLLPLLVCTLCTQL